MLVFSTDEREGASVEARSRGEAIVPVREVDGSKFLDILERQGGYRFGRCLLE